MEHAQFCIYWLVASICWSVFGGLETNYLQNNSDLEFILGHFFFSYYSLHLRKLMRQWNEYNFCIYWLVCWYSFVLNEKQKNRSINLRIKCIMKKVKVRKTKRWKETYHSIEIDYHSYSNLRTYVRKNGSIHSNILYI